MNRIAAVIVTYRPDGDLAARVAAIRREVDRLVLIDNTATPETRERLRAVCTANDAELIAQPDNVGLGGALNVAFARFANEGFIWAIAFDQDSTPAPGFAAQLRMLGERSPGAAVVGANWSDEARPHHPARHLRRSRALPFVFQRVPAATDLDEVTCVITSGSLFHLPTWQELGGFDAALFLDLVDTDYCLRAARAGHPLRVAAAATLLHRRGAKRPVRFLGRTWWPAFMPPLRLRYLFRNRCRLLRRHASSAPHWVAFELVYTAKLLAEILLLEDAKTAKLGACLRGTWDGILGRAGRIAEKKLPPRAALPSVDRPA